MATHVHELRSLLQNLLDGSISQTDLSELVLISRSIAQSHIEHLRSSIISICLQQGLTTTDLAYDCIADAFARDVNNKFLQIENFVGSLRDTLAALPELEIFLAFKSFMIRVADAQLARLYAQCDPAGARIHRDIRGCASKTSFFSLQRGHRGLILRPLEEDPLDHLQPFPFEELEREFLAHAENFRTSHELLKVLHDILKGQAKYSRSITVFDTVQLFKKLYRYEDMFLSEEGKPPSAEGLTDFEIEEIRSHVELALKEKIFLTYFARGKIGRREAEAIFNGLHDMLLDWCSSGQASVSLQEYLSRYFPVDGETYENDYRAKMEYLVKIAREEFGARLMKEI